MVSVDKSLLKTELETVADVSAWINKTGSHSTEQEADVIHRAFKLAQMAHGDQKRASGEPYINHSLAVADILVNLRMDHESIAAAILHDVIEDTDITLADIGQKFGPSIAHLVDGVTKMGIIEYKTGDKDTGQKELLRAESLRKLLLAMAEDVRVVLIKLADRLNNMRTLKHLQEDKQVRIAKETLDIYAPLSSRLGIWQIKWELEDLSLRYLDLEAYTLVAKFLDERRVDRENYIERMIDIIGKELTGSNINAEVNGRPKHIYGIWRKMRSKGIGFHELYDVRAIRIIVEEIPDCYAALGVIHTLWRHIPKEFDDYIATPKENLYQSIHSAVVGPGGKVLEIQIRTRRMHEHAELGIAAHWRYKEETRHDMGYKQKIVWLQQLLEWKDEAIDAGDFIDRFKSEVFQDRVYVLTPEGDVIDLPQGSTALDFAYYIHTEIGHRCRGAKIDGVIVPLTHELKSGDQVEILTTKISSPSRDWLNSQLGYLKTSRARSRVRHWFKQQDQAMSITAGRLALERELHRLSVTGIAYDTLSEHFSYSRVDDFLAAIGRGDITAVRIANVTLALSEPASDVLEGIASRPSRTQQPSDDDVSIGGVGNLLTHMAQCCKPVPGDTITGFITRSRGVTIHRQDCRNILKLSVDKNPHLIAVEWIKSAKHTYSVDITVEAIDRRGLLRDITSVLANEKINLLAVNTWSNKKDNTANMQLTLEITDIYELSRVLNRIEQLPNVYEARRYRK